MQVDWLNSGLLFVPETEDENEALKYLKYFFWSMSYRDRKGRIRKSSLENPAHVVESRPGSSGRDWSDEKPILPESESGAEKEF